MTARALKALIHAFLAALAGAALASLRLAAMPPPSFVPHPLFQLSPAAAGLQQRLVLATPLPGTPVQAAPAPRVVRLPAPNAATALPLWSAPLTPGALAAVLRAAFTPQPAPVRSDTVALTPALAATARTAEMPAAEFQPRALAMSPIALALTTHHSLLVESPVPLSRVSITDGTIAQAIVVSPTQVLIQGRAPGEVSLWTWDAEARPTAYTIRVGLDPEPLQRELDRLYPGRHLQVGAAGDALSVSGTLPNPATAKQVLALASGYSKTVVSDLSVDQSSDPGQVLLQVRFAEVDRSAVSQLGVNLLSNGKGMVGSTSTQQFSPPAGVIAPATTSGQVPGGSVLNGNGGALGLDNLLNVFLFSRSANLGLTLEALEQHNLLQILAEPNLVAMDGKEANFLAGGEFPFPVVQGQGAVNNVTIQFKPFGINLHFKPTILPDGTIDLQVAPEVSALDYSNAVTVSGFLIPALSTRRASTELELADGQSFVIAGLMDNRLTNNLSKIPGLSDIPVLGKLFESRTLNKSRNELVVVVTAHLVHPSATAPAGLVMPEPFLPELPPVKGNPAQGSAGAGTPHAR